MLKTTTYKLTRMGWIAAFVVSGAVACNNSDYKESSTTPADSVAAGAAAATVADSNTAKPDTSSTAATGKPVTKGKFTRGRTSITAPKVYTTADVAPEFPGGENGLDRYINNHVVYPQQALDNDVSAIVHVSFVVDEQGKVTKAKIMDATKTGEDLDKEALRVVNAMPGWTPGKVKGKSVEVRMELPISFQVES
jgi:periplasmic protein TonB